MCEFEMILAFMIASCPDSIALTTHTLSYFFLFSHPFEYDQAHLAGQVF